VRCFPGNVARFYLQVFVQLPCSARGRLGSRSSRALRHSQFGPRSLVLMVIGLLRRLPVARFSRFVAAAPIDRLGRCDHRPRRSSAATALRHASSCCARPLWRLLAHRSAAAAQDFWTSTALRRPSTSVLHPSGDRPPNAPNPRFLGPSSPPPLWQFV